MDKTLLDTDIFSEILKDKHEKVRKTANEYYSIYHKYTISTITVLEIIKGLHKVKREDKIQLFLKSISSAEILSLNVKSSETAGRIFADLELAGQPIGRADPIVASIAIENNIALATGNLSHYERIQKLGYKLRLKNWKEL